jgi:hypothetical protein
MATIKLLAIPIALAVLFGLYSFKLKGENSKLRANIEVAEATISSLRKNLTLQYAELERRGREINDLRISREAKDRQYENILQSNEESCIWGDNNVPSALLDFLCGPKD